MVFRLPIDGLHDGSGIDCCDSVSRVVLGYRDLGIEPIRSWSRGDPKQSVWSETRHAFFLGG